MEEKELNLCEILSNENLFKSKFFSPMLGEVLLSEVMPDEVLVIDYAEEREYSLNSLGQLTPNGLCILFPSKVLYEKYPLDAYAAWMEWKLERIPKRWKAKQREDYWFVNIFFIPKKCTADLNSDFDNKNYENGNMFHTKEEAKQAAEALRECLFKFHENQ